MSQPELLDRGHARTQRRAGAPYWQPESDRVRAASSRGCMDVTSINDWGPMCRAASRTVVLTERRGGAHAHRVRSVQRNLRSPFILTLWQEENLNGLRVPVECACPRNSAMSDSLWEHPCPCLCWNLYISLSLSLLLCERACAYVGGGARARVSNACRQAKCKRPGRHNAHISP